jgi:hypothetical protein
VAIYLIEILPYQLEPKTFREITSPGFMYTQGWCKSTGSQSMWTTVAIHVGIKPYIDIDCSFRR